MVKPIAGSGAGKGPNKRPNKSLGKAGESRQGETSRQKTRKTAPGTSPSRPNDQKPYRRNKSGSTSSHKKTPLPPLPNPSEPMRIAKRIARSGVASRRQAEEMIEAGRISVNGEVLTSPALNVSPKDKILVDGRPLSRPEPTGLWRFYKPAGCVSARRDPEGRPTIFDKMSEKIAPHMISVGRLDYNTEGLLLLTNNGDLARYLELPSTGWLRRYKVRAHGKTDQAILDKLKDGVEVDGVRYGSVEARLDRQETSNIWLTVAIREGKYREVRKVLESIDLEVNRLIRLSYGPFSLGDMKPGGTEKIRNAALKDQLGEEMCAQLGLDEGSQPQTAARTQKTNPGVNRKPDHSPGSKQAPKGPRGRGGKNTRKSSGRSGRGE